MKASIVAIPALALLFLNSCTISNPEYYQLYTVIPTEKADTSYSSISYEDSNCIVSYDFWSEGGFVKFSIYNKTEKDILLDLEKSFFIINGTANPYFRNRITSFSSAAGSAVSYHPYMTSQVSTTGFEVAYHEEKNLYIPARTRRNLGEYKIREELIRDCELLLYPQEDELKKLIYTKDNTPLNFSNRLMYCVGETGEIRKFVNEFYVAELTNVPHTYLIDYKYRDNCNQRSAYKEAFFKKMPSYMFYIRYNTTSDRWEN